MAKMWRKYAKVMQDIQRWTHKLINVHNKELHISELLLSVSKI
jgi:hypothetical protein